MRSHQCRFFAAINKQWNSNQWNNRHRRRSPQRRRKVTPAVALGAVALMGASLGWTEEVPTGMMPSANEPVAVSTENPVAVPPVQAPQQVQSDANLSSHPEVVVTGEQGYRRTNVSSSKYTQPLRNITQTITVIPEELIEDQGATSLRQVLRNVPGISMQAGEGGVPAGDNLAIRGFNARTDFYADGMRDLAGYSRDPFNMESVEVSKGPSSATAGRGSTGGSINQVSKYPNMEEEYGGSFGLGTDEYKRGTLDVNHVIDEEKGTAVRLNAMWHEGNTPRRDEVANERYGFAPSITFGLGTPTQLTLGYYHLTQENVPDYGIPWVPETNTALIGHRGRPAPVDLNNFYGILGRDYEKTTSDVWTAKADHKMNDKMSINSIVRVGESYRDSVITAPRFVSDSTTTLNRQFQSRDQEDDIIANQTNLLMNFKTGPIGHDVVLGFETSEENQLNFARTAPAAATANLFNPDPHAQYAGAITRTGTYSEATSESFAGYLFDSFKLGKMFEVPAGVRWESFETDFKTVAPAGVTTRLERTDTMLSHHVGLVFKPTRNGSIYAGYGNSFNPSAEGLTSGFSATTAIVEPEESKSYEVGTKWDIANRLSLNAAVFETKKEKARTPGGPGEPPTVLDGKQKVEGVEFGASGNITTNWQIFSGATFMTSEIVDSNTAAEVGKEISNTPKASYSIWTQYDLTPAFNLGAGVQYISSRYGNNTNTREVGSYTLYDAVASYQLNPQVALRLNVNNIGDEEYFDSLGGGHLIPGAGRSAFLTTDVKFGPEYK